MVIESSEPVRCRLRGLRAARLTGTAASGENMIRMGTALLSLVASKKNAKREAYEGVRNDFVIISEGVVNSVAQPRNTARCSYSRLGIG